MRYNMRNKDLGLDFSIATLLLLKYDIDGYVWVSSCCVWSMERQAFLGYNSFDQLQTSTLGQNGFCFGST